MGRTEKACQVCGKPFYGGVDCFYCPDCAKIKKLDTVVKARTCQDCGIEFFGGPRAKRCPDCAYKAQRERDRQHKKAGTKRPLGSIDKCQLCGDEYTVASGWQKYCPKCQREAVLAWQREHKKGYSKVSGQDQKKKQRREASQKICIYCLRSFKSSTAENTCSPYCRKEQKKIVQCQADIKRGYPRNPEKYEEKRKKYREECRNEG